MPATKAFGTGKSSLLPVGPSVYVGAVVKFQVLARQHGYQSSGLTWFCHRQALRGDTDAVARRSTELDLKRMPTMGSRASMR